MPARKRDTRAKPAKEMSPPLDEPAMARATQLSALRSMKASPENASRLEEATRPTSVTIRSEAEDKLTFTDLTRDLQTRFRRHVPQHEAFRLVLAFVEDRRATFFEAAGARKREPGGREA